MGYTMEKIKKIAVIGGAGNMGRRYCSILRFLGVEYYIIEKGDKLKIVEGTDGIILSTPTDHHFPMLTLCNEYNLPILCEKPITKKEKELDFILKMRSPLRMINQYEYFLQENKEVKIVVAKGYENLNTYYNYYNSGQDGIIWDCINLIGLSGLKTNINLKNDSPIWECWINSKKIDREKIDESYIWNLEDWLEKFDDRKDYIKKAHNEVWSLLNARNSNSNTDKR